MQLEANALDWLREWMQFPPETRGLFTSGGSMAIFNAIVCARERHLGADIRRGVLYMSDQTHHSVLKAAKLAGVMPEGTEEFTADEQESVGGLTAASKIVFSSSLDEPLAWANSTLVRHDALDAVRAMKQDGVGTLSTIGSLSLSRSLLGAGLVDRFRVVMFPVITGATALAAHALAPTYVMG